MLLILFTLKSLLGIGRGIHPVFKQGSPDATRRNAVYTNVVYALVNGKGSRHRMDGALRGAVGDGVLLTHVAHQTADIHNAALCLPQVRKTEFAHQEVGKDIQLEEIHHVLSGKVVNRIRIGMVTSVVDETVNLTILLDSEIDEGLQVFLLGYVARLKSSLSNMESIHFGFLQVRVSEDMYKFLSFLSISAAEHHFRSVFDKFLN